ncbi:hypothetical protein VPH35_068195 [Triticum aestivum]
MSSLSNCVCRTNPDSADQLLTDNQTLAAAAAAASDESGGLAKCVDFAINSNVKIVHILGTDMSTKMREVTAKHAKKTCIHKDKVHIFYLAAQAKVLLCSLLLETPDV